MEPLNQVSIWIGVNRTIEEYLLHLHELVVIGYDRLVVRFVWPPIDRQSFCCLARCPIHHLPRGGWRLMMRHFMVHLLAAQYFD